MLCLRFNIFGWCKMWNQHVEWDLICRYAQSTAVDHDRTCANTVNGLKNLALLDFSMAFSTAVDRVLPTSTAVIRRQRRSIAKVEVQPARVTWSSQSTAGRIRYVHKLAVLYDYECWNIVTRTRRKVSGCQFPKKSDSPVIFFLSFIYQILSLIECECR